MGSIDQSTNAHVDSIVMRSGPEDDEVSPSADPRLGVGVLAVNHLAGSSGVPVDENIPKGPSRQQILKAIGFLRSSMALNRIKGDDELFVGGVFGANRARLIKEHRITHILSVIDHTVDRENEAFRHVKHLSIDIDDMEDQDILIHLPKIVRFIDSGLRGIDPSDSSAVASPGVVLVHCAMGKSRSVTAIIAYLLWKYPYRFGKSDPNISAKEAVSRALEWVRETRPIAGPNDGFMRQLEMWWDMGCPADSDDAVEREPAYQRWLYQREVEDAARIGRAPDRLRFEDEAATAEGDKNGKINDTNGGAELRCKKCRRVLATTPFIVPHKDRGNADRSDCPHYFIEALSWMRPILEEGKLDGRLACPNTKCGATIGRYAWQGFRCTCGDWVGPAFSLQKSKVDKVVTGSRQNSGRMAGISIRIPPRPVPSQSVVPENGGDKCKQNL